ncbi:MAG: hypothetical protein HY537_00225 [Deltaproteobacteria bacterium]|nr:hypothetical protein [Deltaproteobacteria bacterium]
MYLFRSSLCYVGAMMVFKKQGMNPWLLILISGLVPLALFALISYRWYREKTDLTKIAAQFIQRQNTILAHDAMAVSRRVTDLLEMAERDIRTLALLSPTPENLRGFWLAHAAMVMLPGSAGESTRRVRLPLYSEIAVLNIRGDEAALIRGGKTEKARKLSECSYRDLCDKNFIVAATKLPIGQTHYARVLRRYSPQAQKEEVEDALLRVAFRGSKNIVILGMDYRHVRDILYLPTFPYREKKQLLQAYADGNYIYLIDNEKNIIAHPKHWHVAGIDQATLDFRTPMISDDDDGSHPINIAKYQGKRLKDYFDRLMAHSLVQKEVDVFRAPNLSGTIRVLSVAPILFSKGQYQQTGVFGHVITGCNVDYFEEPKEKLIPYY